MSGTDNDITAPDPDNIPYAPRVPFVRRSAMRLRIMLTMKKLDIPELKKAYAG